MCLCLQTLKRILRLQTRAYILVGTQFITCIIFINILILFLYFLILNLFICIRTPPPPPIEKLGILQGVSQFGILVNGIPSGSSRGVGAMGQLPPLPKQFYESRALSH